MTTLGLKNVNMLSKEQYDGIAVPAEDELYAISGSGFGFPSSYYEDLELGASGTDYTAPANGYFVVKKVSGGSNQWLSVNNNTSGVGYNITANSGYEIAITVPAKKGDVVEVGYSLTGNTNSFRFIYSEGE